MEYQINRPKPKIYKVHFFNSFEARELNRLLSADEHLLGMVSGYYALGTALLCITTRRVLLVDKKMIRFNYEDVLFEAIDEVKYSHQVLLSKIRFYYTGRSLEFKTWHVGALRELAQLAENKVLESRNERKRINELLQQQFAAGQQAASLQPSQPIGVSPYSAAEQVPIMTPYARLSRKRSIKFQRTMQTLKLIRLSQ